MAIAAQLLWAHVNERATPASFSVVAVSSLSLTNQKRGPFHRDFNFAARFSIVLLLARARFAIKMCRTRRQTNFELAKFARR